ncbi:Asp23/Gls24 family envelope stress response protein [Streptomyces sp. NPDC005533]|uniref:Asp23/Gls24 family envelope stress response protein n=1 Tax=Streptomyces sp. NPDC005533 TaxID=3364723 RepID=UPI0036906CF5
MTGGIAVGPDRELAGRGRTTISSGVVEKVAGLAAREVEGVYALGSSLTRAFGVVRDRVPGGARSAVSRGVKAEVGERQAALELEIVIDYGVSIGEVALAIREEVISAVEGVTGLEVVEVNIAVTDVKLPNDDGLLILGGEPRRAGSSDPHDEEDHA